MDVFALFSPITFALVWLGVMVGIIFGAIPGLTATMAVAVFLPLTYALDMQQALGLLLGLYVGGISGGLVPAILINIPGTPSSIATCFDGYPMTLKNESEKALKIAIVASLFGGLFSTVILYFFAPALADVAIKFSYVEKFLIILFAMSVIASLSKGSFLVGIFSGVLGIFLSLIGTYDINVGGNGKTRLMFDFMRPYLKNGFSLLPVLIGLFGIATLLLEAEKGMREEEQKGGLHITSSTKFSWGVFRGQFVNLIRSSFIGTFIGFLPGIGGSAASIMAYSQAKNFSKDPTKMGTGVPEGIIASESSNNGLTGGALIPMLSLGIPGDSTTAVLIGAFTLHGLQVGPLFIGSNLDVWRTMMISILVANVAMFLFMYFAIKHIVKIITVPKYILYPMIIVMCVIGAYTINYGILFDVWTLLIFGVVGYLAEKIGIQVPPLLIGFILGKDMEVFFVKSLESFKTLTIFFTKSPIAGLLWILIGISIAFSIYVGRKEKRQHAIENKEKQA